MLRDYNKHPLNITKNGVNSEKPYKEDLEYLYIQCNLSGKELSFYFNTSIPTIKRWLKFFNIQKSKKLKTLKIKNTCLKKYGKSHFNNRKKSEQTCLKKYGVKNISQVSFIQNKKYKTMKINNTFGSSKEENTIYIKYFVKNMEKLNDNINLKNILLDVIFIFQAKIYILNIKDFLLTEKNHIIKIIHYIKKKLKYGNLKIVNFITMQS